MSLNGRARHRTREQLRLNRLHCEPTRDWNPTTGVTMSLCDESHGRGAVPTVFWDGGRRQGTERSIALKLDLNGWLVRFIRSQT